MKRTNRILAVLLTLLMLCSAVLPAFASDTQVIDSGTCGETMTWQLNSDGVLSIDGTGNMESYGEAYDENGFAYPATPWSTYRDRIKRVEIGPEAAIDSNAFVGCYAISAFSVDYRNPYYASDADGCLYDENRINLYQYPVGNSRGTYTVSDMVKYIGPKAFFGCNRLQQVVIPENVLRIHGSAFQDCDSLTEVKLSEGLQYIGSSAFDDCDALLKIQVPDSVVTITSKAFGDRYKVIVHCNENSFAADWAKNANHPYVINGSTQEENIIHKTVSETLAFTLDQRTQTLTVDCLGELPDNTSFEVFDQPIGMNIMSVEISDGCTAVGEYVFSNCRNLRTVRLPDGLQTIGRRAFSSSGLQQIDLPESVTAIGDSVFNNNQKLQALLIPNKVTSIGKSLANYCRSLKYVVLGNGVKTIPSTCFIGCSQLETIQLGNSVKTIDPSAFEGCSALRTLILPSSVRTISGNAFANTGLQDVYFYSLNNAIDGTAFPAGITVHGFNGSDAQRFADTYGLPFVSLNDELTHEHDRFFVKGYAPTCNDDGLTDGYRCLTCGAWVEEPQPIPALGHDYQLTETVVPTENSAGWQRYACTRCDSFYTQMLAPATHQHVFQETERVNATCTAQGYVTYRCEVCNFTYTDFLPAAGHSFEAWTTFLPVTAGEKGVDIRFCAACGDYELRKSEMSSGDTPPVEPEHTHEFKLIENKEPTCTLSGYQRYLCACGAVTMEITDALGHMFQHVETVKPTCESAGHTLMRCARCKEEEKTDITPATGHSILVKAPVAPTCTQPGWTESRACEWCGTVFAEAVEIPALGHNWSAWVTVKPASETEEGLMERTCLNDPEHKEVQVLDKLDPQPQTDPDPEPAADVCPWCGGSHTGFFQGIVGFFHRLMANLFGAKY